jgi:hypothetical protein
MFFIFQIEIVIAIEMVGYLAYIPDFDLDFDGGYRKGI